MVEKAEGIGLEFDSQYLQFFTPRFNSVLQDSMTVMYKLMGQHIRPIGVKMAGDEVIHKSDIDRRNLTACDYHPENLESFLAKGTPYMTVSTTTRVPTGTPRPPLN
jgi:hypothetical protein